MAAGTVVRSEGRWVEAVGAGADDCPVSVRVRQATMLLVLGLLLLGWAARPGPMLSFGQVQGFPEDVVAAVPPVPNAYADRPDVRVLQLLSSMTTMWTAAFTAAGDRYRPPRIELEAARAGHSVCGRAPARWSGLYCTRDERVYIDMDDHLVIRAAGGDDAADDMLGYVLAHEVGHHVQHLRGGVPTSADQVLRRELHAECLAGVWGRAAGREPPPAWSYTGDAEHGTAAQQQHWLERGYARARPADCDDVLRVAL